MRQGLAPAGIIASMAQSVNPVVGAVVTALQEIGFALLDEFLLKPLEEDGPKRLFVRNYPSSCVGVDSEEGLTLGSEEAAIGGGLAAREAQMVADRAAAAALADAAEQLRLERESRRSTVPWVEIGVGVGVAAVIGLAVRALAGGRT
jgi:hypothetical protein